MAYVISPSLISLTILQATCLNTIANNLNILSLHNHSGSLGEGNVNILAGSATNNTSLLNRIEEANIELSTACATFFYAGSRIDAAEASASNNLSFNTVDKDMPRGRSWGYRAIASSAMASGIGVKGRAYLVSGTYRIDVYHRTGPCGGVFTIANGASNIVDVDTYQAASTFAVGGGSFFGGGASPAVITITLAGSKHASATGCNMLLGPVSVRWIGS